DAHDEPHRWQCSTKLSEARDAVALLFAFGGFDLGSGSTVGPSSTMLVAERRFQDPVAYPYRLGRDFDQLLFVDPFQRGVKRGNSRGRQPDRLVMAGRADIGELLFAAH